MIYLPVHEQSEDQLSMPVRIKSKILPADILYILLLAALLRPMQIPAVQLKIWGNNWPACDFAVW